MYKVVFSWNRFGYLDNLSLVGTAAEESGGYFPDILDMLEEIPVLHLVSSIRGSFAVEICEFSRPEIV